MTLRQKRERRAAIGTEMRSIHDANPDGALPADRETRWNELEAERRSLDAAIAREEAVDDADRRMVGVPLDGERRARADGLPHGFNLARAIGHRAGLRSDGGADMEALGDFARRSGRASEGLVIPLSALAPERRTMTTTTPTAGPGGNLIPTDLLPPEDALRDALVLPSLGARVLTGLNGNVDLPVASSAVSVAFVPENTAVPVVDIPVGKSSLRAKTAGVIVELGRNLLLQDSPDCQQFVQQHLLRSAARGIQRAALIGAGANGEPLGVLNTPGINTVSFASETAPALFNTAADLLGAIEDSDGDTSPPAFVTNSAVRRLAAKQLDTQGHPIGVGTVFQGAPTFFSNVIPRTLGSNNKASAIIAGAWENLVIGVWSAGEILINPYAADSYARGAVQIRLLLNIDVAVIHPGAFAVATDVAA